MFPKEGQQRAFNQFMDLFVLPEVKRRKEAGLIPKDFTLKKAQVVFVSDGTKPSIRLNDEAKIVAKVRLKKGTKKKKGESVSWNEIEETKILRLPDDEEPKYAHISMARVGNHWLFAFDFLYNKDLSRRCFNTAKQFLESAIDAFQNKRWAPFIDNLFTCVELLAKSELLLTPDPKFRKKTTHKGIQLKYNQFVAIGNAKKDYKDALNKLGRLRNSARYLKAAFELTKKEAQIFLSIAKDMIGYLEPRLAKH